MSSTFLVVAEIAENTNSVVRQQSGGAFTHKTKQNPPVTMPPRSISTSSTQSVYTINDDCDDVSTMPTTLLRKSPTSRVRRPLTKSVCFNTTRNEVHPIPHLNDLTDDDIANIWYEAAEYSDIKSSYQCTIFKMENGEFIEDEEHTSRGLEYRTQQGAWARYENKRDAYNAVLDEQDRQWKVDKDDHDKIGAIYLQHSSKCAKAAAERGLADYKHARAICQDILKKRSVRRKKSKKTTKQKEPSNREPPQVENVRNLLQKQSFSMRGQIREDIQKEQAKALKKDRRQVVAAV